MEQYELSIDISNHGDMNHTFINMCVCMQAYVIDEIWSENDRQWSECVCCL